MDKLIYPGWRSLLCIPVHINKFIEKAHTRDADAYVLDLEDSVPNAQKRQARTQVIDAARQVSRGGAAALVRINQDHAMAIEDLDASVHEAISAIVVPKVEQADFLLFLADRLCELEHQRGLPAGHTGIIAMVESVQALPALDAIASAHPRLMAMTLGSEDFAASAAMVPTCDTLYMPNQLLAFACRRANIIPLGIPDSIADFSDPEQFMARVQQARDMGFEGALCIHPAQVASINQVMTPDAAAVAEAEALLAHYEQAVAEGRGAVEFKGKMVELPSVIRARQLLRQAQKRT